VTDQPYEGGSRVEAVEAVVHAHHPDDTNHDVVRGRLGPHAVLAGLVAAFVTVAGVVGLALAIGGGR
jgi:hypothetical protein